MHDRPMGGAREPPGLPAGPRPPRRGWTARLLGLSLYLKIVVAASLLLGGAVAAGALVAHAAPPPHVRGWLALGVLAVAAANALLVHLALLPLKKMESVVQEVEHGNLTQRVPISPLADRNMVRVVQVVNRMLDALQAAGHRERDLASRLARGEEEERKQLSGELLDGTAQLLSSTLLQLQLVRRTLVESQPHRLQAGRAALEQARKGTALALEEVGRIARGLRPPELDELGPFRALEIRARHLLAGQAVRWEVEGDGPPADLTPELSLALFRILQEGITNAVTHADARHIRLRSHVTGQALVCDLEDDGRGFDVVATLRAPETALGLLRMHEQARRVGGRLELTSAPGAGTRLRLEVPHGGDVPLG
ncbi:MAG: ATP-binding protein [Gemmatimonadota bacterium]